MSLTCSGCCLLGMLVAALAAWPAAGGQRPDYPPTKTGDTVETLHGERIADPYRWLEDGDDPNVQTWVDAQNALTQDLLGRFPQLRQRLEQRFEELIQIKSVGTPSVVGRRPAEFKYFFYQRDPGQDHAVLYLRDGDLDAEAREVINPNTFSEDGTTALDWYHASPDGRLIAYGRSEGGSEQSTLWLRDVATGTDLALKIPQTRACSLVWDRDSAGFHYTRYPQPGSVPEGDERYYRKVFYHRFGTDWRDDPVVYGEGRPKEAWPGIGHSTDGRFHFLTDSTDWTRNDLSMRPAGRGEFQPVAVGLDGLFGADVSGERVFIRTNYEAPRYRILVAPVDTPGQEHWRELIPQQSGVIADMRLITSHIVLHVIENAYSRLLLFDLQGKPEGEIELPGLGRVSQLSGRSDHDELFFRFESFAYPRTNFRYHAPSGKLTVLERSEVEVDFDAYQTQQVWFESRDGTRVPMFIVSRRDTPRDGTSPAILYGYGGFNASQTPFFYSVVFPWLDAGGTYCLVNARGGGEFGREWHLAGRGAHKQNTFDDFIAAAEFLIDERYTSADRLGLGGGSNGGLTVGAVLTQRPDLVRAVYCGVPLLDMLRYHHKQIARLWIPEYGDPDDPEQFRWLFGYSPYHHVKEGVEYPAVLLTAGQNDSRVDPMHARKMTARLQAATAAPHPILLRIEGKGGHGAGSPVSQYIEKQVDMWTFYFWQLGVASPEEGS